MKKFLSLVLALVMTMSLVTISAGAADFTDDSAITYDKAVAVVSAAKVVDGYTDGSFGPSATLTRGAAAKIICNMILSPTTASALVADTAPYSDVPTSNVFSGYIAYCAQQGIISGYADGTFRPAATLTGYAFMKMLLGALGYDASIEGYTGANWSINVAKQALAIELDDGLVGDFNGVKALTREEACLYAYNTLLATMVEYDSKTTVSVNGATVNVGNQKASDVTSPSSTAQRLPSDIADDETVQFCEKYFSKLKGDTDVDDFGRPAIAWTYDGEDVGTYANTADKTLVVKDADKALSELTTDGDYAGIKEKDVLDAADVYFNGQPVGKYSAHKADSDLAGKGDIIEFFENDNNDVDTIVVKSYTYAKIDDVDTDLSSTLKNKGASTSITLVDIDGDELGNGDYYNDHDDDEKVLNGFSADEYDKGTVIAVALGDKDAVLDSYVVESVSGSPTAARKSETYNYAYGIGNYFAAGKGVKNGSITVGGTKYNYAAQFSGLDTTESVDFDKTYTVYLTAEGYALAVDGDAAASLDDVYYVSGGYVETSKGTDTYYVQAVSVSDGVEHELKLDSKYFAGGSKDTAADYTSDIVSAIDKSAASFVNTFAGVYELKASSGAYHGTEWTGNSKYDLHAGALTANVTNSSTVIRNGVTSYIQDNTFFVGIEDEGSDIDISTATGKMTVDTSSKDLTVYVIADDDDAVFVIYAAKTLDGATNVDDIVYLDDKCTTENNDGWEGTIWYMKDRTSADVTVDDDSDKTSGSIVRGFYTYTESDDIYKLEESNDALGKGEVASKADGFAVGVVFSTARTSSATAPASFVDKYDGNTYYNTVTFTGTAFASGVKVIDTRGSSSKKVDVYSNEINTVAKLVSALNKGYVTADVYVEDGDITFVAVTACVDA